VPFPVTDRAWRQVSVSARECLGSKCPDRVDCFSEKAREAAKEADVVVANHTLLALDVFTGVSVLPEREAVVLDEAHEFVESVTDALSHELALGDVRRAVAAGHRPGVGGDAAAPRGGARRARGVLQLVEPGWVRALDGTPRRPRHAGDGRRRASAEITRELASSELAGEDVELARLERRAPPGRRWPRRPARSARRRWPRRLRRPGRPSTRLRVSPLRVGGALGSRLFGDTTVVATSATLSLGGSFRHAAASSG
jgi:ATP-dependent DNA helicase DinG